MMQGSTIFNIIARAMHELQTPGSSFNFSHGSPVMYEHPDWPAFTLAQSGLWLVDIVSAMQSISLGQSQRSRVCPHKSTRDGTCEQHPRERAHLANSNPISSKLNLLRATKRRTDMVDCPVYQARFKQRTSSAGFYDATSTADVM